MSRRPQQPRLFNPNMYRVNAVTQSPSVASAAAEYARRLGLKWKAPKDAPADLARGHETYLAYRNDQSNPEEAPGIRKSYEVLRSHISDQFKHLTAPESEGGMGFHVEFTDEDPYPDAESMAQDVSNKRIKAMKTASTGGHNFFTNEENDQFRAVHDVFGHAAIGKDFSRHGEEAAFLSHIQMFPKEAHAALASELRGQNAYLNYGPDHEFPDQSPGTKLIKLPEWTEGNRMPKQKVDTSQQPAYEQGRLF